MTTDEIPLEYMRVRKFLSTLAQSIGERLGWTSIEIARPEDPLYLTVSRTVTQSLEMISGTYSFEYQADLYHYNGWYHHDTDGMCLVTYGNGATYLRNGFPMIAGVLYLIAGDSRFPPPRRLKLRNGREPLTMQQGKYRGGILLFALPDGSLALSDEHPFYHSLRADYSTLVKKKSSAVQYVFSGITPDAQTALVSEIIYRADLIEPLARRIIECVITFSEGAHAPSRPLLAVLPSPIQDS